MSITKEQIDDLFEAASTHSYMVCGEGITSNDEIFQIEATPEEKITAVTEYMRNTI